MGQLAAILVSDGADHVPGLRQLIGTSVAAVAIVFPPPRNHRRRVIRLPRCRSPQCRSHRLSSFCPGIAMVETSRRGCDASRSPGFLIDRGLPRGVSLPNPSWVFPSRSKIRYCLSVFSGNDSRNCCTTHSPVGCSVTFQWMISRRSSRIKTRSTASES